MDFEVGLAVGRTPVPDSSQSTAGLDPAMLYLVFQEPSSTFWRKSQGANLSATVPRVCFLLVAADIPLSPPRDAHNFQRLCGVLSDLSDALLRVRLVHHS